MIILYDAKPDVPKAILKDLRKQKWELAEKLLNELKLQGFSAVMFEDAQTPHIRVMDVDIWMATSRFYDRINKKWGLGVENYKIYLNEVKIKNKYEKANR